VNAPGIHLDAALGDVGMPGRPDKMRPDPADVHTQGPAQPFAIVGLQAEMRLEPPIDVRVARVVHRHPVRHTLVEHGQDAFA